MKKSCSGIMRVLNMSFQHMSLYFEWCSIALSTVIKDAHCPIVSSRKLTCKYEVISLWKPLYLSLSACRNGQCHDGNLNLSDLVQETRGNLYVVLDLTNELVHTAVVLIPFFLSLKDHVNVRMTHEPLRCPLDIDSIKHIFTLVCFIISFHYRYSTKLMLF